MVRYRPELLLDLNCSGLESLLLRNTTGLGWDSAASVSAETSSMCRNSGSKLTVVEGTKWTEDPSPSLREDPSSILREAAGLNCSGLRSLPSATTSESLLRILGMAWLPRMGLEMTPSSTAPALGLFLLCLAWWRNLEN